LHATSDQWYRYIYTAWLSFLESFNLCFDYYCFETNCGFKIICIYGIHIYTQKINWLDNHVIIWMDFNSILFLYPLSFIEILVSFLS
jgi:hypothetical protein